MNQDGIEASLPRSSPYKLELPSIKLARMGLSEGDTVAVSFEVIDDKFTIKLTPDWDSVWVPTRDIVELQRQSGTLSVTIPKRAVEAANIGGKDVTIETEGDALYAKVDDIDTIDSPEHLDHVTESVVTEESNNAFTIRVHSEVDDALGNPERVWTSVGYGPGSDIVLLVDSDGDKAPDYAYAMSVTENYRKKSGVVGIPIPKTVISIMRADDRTLQYGCHDGRLYATFLPEEHVQD